MHVCIDFCTRTQRQKDPNSIIRFPTTFINVVDFRAAATPPLTLSLYPNKKKKKHNTRMKRKKELKSLFFFSILEIK